MSISFICKILLLVVAHAMSSIVQELERTLHRRFLRKVYQRTFLSHRSLLCRFLWLPDSSWFILLVWVEDLVLYLNTNSWLFRLFHFWDSISQNCYKLHVALRFQNWQTFSSRWPLKVLLEIYKVEVHEHEYFAMLVSSLKLT